MNSESRQVKYWRDSGMSDLDTADLLMSNNKILHGLFFCHLSVEKMLKAHYSSKIGLIPPRTHNLSFLLEKSNLTLKEDEEDFLGVLMKYQLEGRYPNYRVNLPSASDAKLYFEKTKILVQWLASKL